MPQEAEAGVKDIESDGNTRSTTVDTERTVDAMGRSERAERSRGDVVALEQIDSPLEDECRPIEGAFVTCALDVTGAGNRALGSSREIHLEQDGGSRCRSLQDHIGLAIRAHTHL